MKFLSLMVTLVAVMPLVADTQSEWYASLSNKREATSVRVGGEDWHTSDADKPLPYRFPCGAVLHSTAGGLRLDLNNTIIDGGIYAYGDISIFLIGDSVSFGSVKSEGSMLIFGYGSLLVNRLDKPGSYDSLYYGGVTSDRSLSVCMGASVTVKEPAGTGLHGSDSVFISASTVGVHGAGKSGIFSYNRVEILGAAVAISSYCDGIEAQGGGGVVIDGSVLNVFSRDDGIEGYAGINITHSYASIASIVNDVRCYALCAAMSNNAEVRLENSIVKLLSRGFSSINTYKVTFGEGDYYIATDSPYSGAISVDDVYVSGGNVRVCAPGEDGSCVKAWHFQIDSGCLEIVDKIDVREFLKFDAAAAAAFTGTLASGIDVTSLMANFYSQVILDAISNCKIGNLNGVPNVGIDCSGSFDVYTQNGGTVWCDLPKYGVMCRKPVMNGGSYKGQFYNPSYSYTISGGHDSVSPVNSSGNALKCVSYAVAGAKKYDKITQSWSGILPSYYGTGSLYTDAAGKLYFWLPSCNLTLKPSSTKHGTVSGGGTYKFGAKATIKAKAKSGYVLAGWFTDKSCKKPLNPKGYDNRKPTVKYTMPAKNTTVYAKFVTKAAAKKSLKFSSATKKLAKTAKKATAGKAFSLALGISSASLPTVTAKGLPKGLKIDKTTGKITGVGTVPGAYTATITVKDAAGNKITQKVKITVETAAFANGTFYGTAKPGKSSDPSAYLQFSVRQDGQGDGQGQARIEVAFVLVVACVLHRVQGDVLAQG